VVDSDTAFLAFAAEALNSFRPGFEVTTAASMEVATQWLHTISPDLMLVGLNPQDTAAKTQAQSFRANSLYRCSTIVFLSDQISHNLAEPDDPACEAVYPKPSRLTDLLGLVQSYMNI
jgi:DNA-binding response OmpR family regulator